VKIFQTKSIVSKNFIQKDFLLLTFIQKGSQKCKKSLPNWMQIPTSIHFPSLCCHQGISVPRMTLEISSYPSIDLPLFLFGLLLMFRMHLRKHTESSMYTSPKVFSRYHIYIFSRKEGSLSCLRLTQGVIPMSTTRLQRLH
jgi:hypothetical protein